MTSRSSRRARTSRMTGTALLDRVHGSITFLGHLSKRVEDMRQRWATLAIASGRGEPAASFPPWRCRSAMLPKADGAVMTRADHPRSVDRACPEAHYYPVAADHGGHDLMDTLGQGGV